ncbi:MAG: Uma2 family endonuclease [Oscillospiraceae bacterium]|nr:Uma2 family endonuclease [Oscillospiraceae bacterium]
MEDYDIKKELPDLLFKEPRRYEIHEGKIYYMAGAPTGHGDVILNLTTLFKNFLKGRKWRVFNENVNVTFKRNFREYMPDVKIVCDPNKIKKDGIHGAPDLIVEVLSPNTQKNDRGYKFDLYEQNGVKEYWIVDIGNKNVEVYLLKDNKFELDNIYHHFSDEDIKEIEEFEIENDEVKAEKEMIKVKTMKTSLFGDDLIINIADVFENID